MHVMIGTNDEGNLRRKVRKGTYEDRGWTVKQRM